MNSSRFPGKPLKKINGIPMIEIIYNKVNACKFIDKTIVATCDYEIKNHNKRSYQLINFYMFDPK